MGAIETTALAEPEDQVEFVRKEAGSRGVPLVTAAAGERRRLGTLDWQVLWPPPSPPLPPSPPPPLPPSSSPSRPSPPSSGPPLGTSQSPSQSPIPIPGPALEGPNDASVTLLVRTAGLRVLLLGDLEPPAQQALLRSPAAGLLGGVDVLKVAHHGSAYQDPELIRAVAPRLALISCGADNAYGHPAPSTVAALRAGGAVVLRTDRDGALAVSGEGGDLRVAVD